jgi:hypothetical protein
MSSLTSYLTVTAALALTVLTRGPLAAGEPASPQDLLTDEIRNDHPSFAVRVDVDKPDRTYVGGEEMRVSVRSGEAGFLYLLYCDASKNVTCLFPNAFGQENRIAAGQPIVLPQPPQPGVPSFRLRIGPPYGRELLKAIVSRTPMDEKTLARLLSSEGTQARLAGVRAVYVEAPNAGTDWAEHHVEIVTRAPDSAVAATGQAAVPDASSRPGTRPAEDGSSAVTGSPKRVGVFIGISQYADPRIHGLTVCANDATTMASVMRRHGQVGQGWVLVNEQATRKAIEHVLRRQVVAATRPNDTVIIYWSGHGARCADDNGDEKDGFDEYLVPYDGRLDDLDTIRQTMVLDDAFGRWLQELDGRRIVVVLDACHSAGLAEGGKSIARSVPRAASRTTAGGFDFLDGELARIKDIGQRETALLASSAASQVSFERREGDLSTMTYFLVEQLQSAAGPVALADAFSHMKRQVAEYVERKFPGTTQTMTLVNNLSETFYLRP